MAIYLFFDYFDAHPGGGISDCRAVFEAAGDDAAIKEVQRVVAAIPHGERDPYGGLLHPYGDYRDLVCLDVPAGTWRDVALPDDVPGTTGRHGRS